MFSFFNKTKTIKPTTLVVLDGWGIAPMSPGNAILQSSLNNFINYVNSFPNGSIIASGESVGLPANEVGNSEVGHLTIGAGRVVDQSLVKINRGIERGTFFENQAFVGAVRHIENNNGALHLLGMVSSGNVHSSNAHLYALIDFCIKNKVRKVYLHLITDGRDAPPNASLEIFKELEAKIRNTQIKIASIVGRYYAMDRDARWERTKVAYELLTEGKGNLYPAAAQAVASYYKSAITDEFIPGTVINSDPDSFVKNNDALIFFNFRIDRPRQLSMAFCLPDFEYLNSYDWGFDLDQGSTKSTVTQGPTFKRSIVPKNLYFVTMTEYQQRLPVSAIAYPNEKVANTMAEVISVHYLNQLHLAESEKERMVTFYFDGLKTDRFVGEDVLIVASPKVATYDKYPKMSVDKIAKEYKKAIDLDKYHFLVLNIANPDMVAHTGNIEATIKACSYVDKYLSEIVDSTLNANGTVFITADHGNAEELVTYESTSFYYTSKEGSTNTEHSNNPVPFVIMNKSLVGRNIKLSDGVLSDVAPTILESMNLKAPIEMTGVSKWKEVTK